MNDFLVVGIGASAGGLEACRKLLVALPEVTGMAFILIQHLDPKHESMLVDLLASHTTLTVREAVEGMVIAPDHLYVIPPGTSLGIAAGRITLSQPLARHGARLPVDFLLHSLASAYGMRAVCIILSGSGADGSLGLQSIKAAGGFVIVQDQTEAGYDGMPRNAIATGVVDRVLAVESMPSALMLQARQTRAPPVDDRSGDRLSAEGLTAIIELLRHRTAHDFLLYKPGTLQRRIERRMSSVGIRPGQVAEYLARLHDDPAELELLNKDLLINVTSFFRDPNVFRYLAEEIFPGLVDNTPNGQPVRVWSAGCSTGEEAYSLAILFHEAIANARSGVRLQVFASDIDSDAVALAREGLYPEAIAEAVSPERLSRFFIKHAQGYRVSSELRGSVIFTVQDVITDPPFSTLDLVSCRNLLIYLRPEAQEKVLSALHFALRPGGLLLLGGSETTGSTEGRFKVVSKTERIYRRVGPSRSVVFGNLKIPGEGARVPVRPGQGRVATRQAVLADLCRHMVIEAYAPAAVLVNSRYECLYSLGPTDRYLHVPPGNPTLDLMAMARPNLRNRLRSAIDKARREKTRSIVVSGPMGHATTGGPFRISVQTVPFEGEELSLVCFIDTSANAPPTPAALKPGEITKVGELEQELAATRLELEGAIRNLEISGEEQQAINEEVLSSNEEYQSTNEELLTSKEELQSLNEELTALNGQLQETLERQRTTANDLQNVLYSTDVATLFLDRGLRIRFFTPATRALFNVIPSDVGRPLADLQSLAMDSALSADAQAVIVNIEPVEREIKAQNGTWFVRRVLPYRTHDDSVEGVVITFTDITERKNTARALEVATRDAELANIAKTRFLAAANHDLRQPLQTLALLQGLLAKRVEGERAQQLIARLDDTLGAMSGMLNTLLDINQIETGSIKAETTAFPVGELLLRLRDEFDYHAEAQGLSLRVVSSDLMIQSDPRLLEQMLRNLVANALKYTEHGKILLGCRRAGKMLSIEVWDTGIGIPQDELAAIFEEYHQLDNAARERSRGLGLGLSIVQRLATLLNHRITVGSTPGKGSHFSIEVAVAARPDPEPVEPETETVEPPAVAATHRTGLILIVEDDPEVREMLELSLKDDGHRTITAADGKIALDTLAGRIAKPDLVLADYNLPKGLNGLQLIAQLRAGLRYEIPAVVLTGDISQTTLREIAGHNCTQLNKPLKLEELMQVVQRLLTLSAPAVADAQGRIPGADTKRSATVHIVDDDRMLRDALRAVLEDEGVQVEDYPDCETFLTAYQPGSDGCLLLDAYLPGISGLDLLRHIGEKNLRVPVIMITGNSDVPMAVLAMKAGASDFIEKPVGREELLASITRALEQARDSSKVLAWREEAAGHMAGLTTRQRQIMEMVLAGHPSKNIAADLGISQRTVENHRASIMKRTKSKSLPALARLAIAAATNAAD
jgi:two-component system CheB/CheR fusion protein